MPRNNLRDMFRYRGKSHPAIWPTEGVLIKDSESSCKASLLGGVIKRTSKYTMLLVFLLRKEDYWTGFEYGLFGYCA